MSNISNYPSASTPPAGGEDKKKNNSLLIAALVVALVGTWAYVLWDKNAAKEDLTVAENQSQSYMSQRDSLKLMYDAAEIRLDSITGLNNSLIGEKSDLQKQIDANKSEIRRILNDRNASAADLKRAQGLIANLNGQIRNLENEIARLTGENQELQANNAHLTSEKQVLEQNLQVSSAHNQSLEESVDVGSTFSASNINIAAIQEKRNGKEKETTKAKKADKLMVSFDIENRIARSGPTDMYIVVTNPEGNVVNESELGSGLLSTRSDGDKSFTTKIMVNYEQGVRKTIQFPIKQDKFDKGSYKIEVYHNGFKIGEGVRTLKKGGLFG